MEGRTVGSGAVLALDSDPSRSTLALASLTAAVAGPSPAGPGAGAGLVYAPTIPAGSQAGGLFVLSECLTPAADGMREAACAADYLARAFGRSLCHDPGRSLASAVQATGEWLRQRAWTGGALVQCALAAVAVAGGQAWAMTTGGTAVYRLAGDGTWARLTTGVPQCLAPGDLLVLLSPGLLNRVPATVIGSELQALVAVIPARPARALAEWAVNLAAQQPGPGTPLALVARMGAAPPNRWRSASRSLSPGNFSVPPTPPPTPPIRLETRRPARAGVASPCRRYWA